MSQSEVIIARSLFDEKSYESIRSFMRNELRYLPLAHDETDFVRKYAHNLPFFVDIHHQLSEFASEQFKEALKPSYSFISMYQDGGTCPLHIDRPQCYRTIDYLIEQDDPEPWPICVSRYMTDEEVAKITSAGKGYPLGDDREELISSEQWESIDLAPNDAVLYSGTNAWHYRPTILSGTASLAFFHFVPEDFDGPLD